MSASRSHVLFLAPGAKVALVRALAESCRVRGLALAGWENDPYSPAVGFCQTRVEGGPIDCANTVDRLLAWCSAHGVKLIVPSRHDDLPILGEAAERFSAAGVPIAISAPKTIQLCLDKSISHTWLREIDMPVPDQSTMAALKASPFAGHFPLVAKHPRGSGSRSVRLCRSEAELIGIPCDWIVQTHADGIEYTINTYASRDGRCLCEIPHERILTSDGEVVRGRTAHIPELMSLARRITESLPGARGPLNIQIFWDAPTRRATVIEINPRFGGGYPLAHEAGGKFTEWLLTEYIDGVQLPRLDAWEDGLVMARYREAMFFPSKR